MLVPLIFHAVTLYEPILKIMAVLVTTEGALANNVQYANV